MNRKKRYAKKRCGFSQKLVYGLIGFLLILLLHQAFSSFFYDSNTGVSQFSEFKAAIVDNLSLTVSNQTFIETATTILKDAGFTIDYYPYERVTVEFYRNLPTLGYGLIVLRVHSSATWGANVIEAPVALFTSERVSLTKHVYEQLADQLVWVAFSREEREKGIEYFGISPLFVTQSMRGRFQDTIVVMMGCEGLSNTQMAKAFVEKGAKVYISWSDSVLASHTDSATSHLLQHFLIERYTLKKSIQKTFNEVGFDPVYKSLLLYYPLEAGKYTIQNATIQDSSLITDRIKIKIREMSNR